MDVECFESLSALRLPQLVPIAVEEFEKGDADLLAAKLNRTRIEYYFTCTPALVHYLLERVPEIDVLSYLDADLFFFADPAPIFEEMKRDSIVIVEHRFGPETKDCGKFGIYNVGWISFRRDADGVACVRWWRERCIEWCYDRLEDGKYADQKYLDDWPTRFPRVVVLQHKGANVAPWNLSRYRIRRCNASVFVDEQPLLFFHFQALKELEEFVYDPSLFCYGVSPSLTMLRHIYAPYLRTLRHVRRELQHFLGVTAKHTGIRDVAATSAVAKPSLLKSRIADLCRRWGDRCRGLLAGRYFVAVGGSIVFSSLKLRRLLWP